MKTIKNIFKQAVLKPVLKTILGDKKIISEMESMGWSHRLSKDNPIMPLYEWRRPDGTTIEVYNLAHTEAPPSNDPVFKKDRKIAKNKVADRILGL